MRPPKHEKYPEPKEANPWHHEEKWLETEPTPPLAQLAFEREFFTDGIEQLGAQKVTAERDLWNAYEQAVKALPAQCPIPEPDLTEHTALEIVRKRWQIAQDRLRWVEEKTALLRQETEQKVEQLRKDYQAATGLWQTALGQVEERYNRLYITWERGEQRWQAEIQNFSVVLGIDYGTECCLGTDKG